MSPEFWEIAEPFLGQTAQEIVNGEKYTIFRAVMVSFGEPLSKENCVTCVSDGLKSLRKAYRKQFKTMANKNQTYILKDLAVAWKGERYEQDTMTDEVAKDMLSVHPEYAALFKVIPAAKPKQSKKADKVEEGKE